MARRINIIGLGGVGGSLILNLCLYLNSRKSKDTIVLIDGDAFESKNRERQLFTRLGRKVDLVAERLERELSDHCPRLHKESSFVTSENVEELIGEYDITFLCVDNHRTRKLVSDRIGQLQDGTLISGGNDHVDGNVQLYVRKDGVDVTEPLTFHSEIADPQDENPGEQVGCEVLAATGEEPQLLAVNMLVASFILATFWTFDQWQSGEIDALPYGEIYLDISTGKALSHLRLPEKTAN